MANQGRWLGDWPGDWYGADGAAPTQAAPRSLLAFWAGGAVVGVEPATTVGVRSLLAPWMGGASAPSGAEPPATAAPRGLLGFWAGGYSVGAEIPPEPEQAAPQNVYGSGDLAEQVARGERGSGGWWGYVAPRPVEREPDAPLPASAPEQPRDATPEPAAPAAFELQLPPLSAADRDQLAALLPSARNAEEAAMILAMVLGAPLPAPKVTVTTGAPPPTDEELAMMGLLLAAASSAKH